MIDGMIVLFEQGVQVVWITGFSSLSFHQDGVAASSSSMEKPCTENIKSAMCHVMQHAAGHVLGRISCLYLV